MTDIVAVDEGDGFGLGVAVAGGWLVGAPPPSTGIRAPRKAMAMR